ncbi:MAG: hypothetical protein GX681_08820 [Clostridiaceae bacterium]|nr:hypothetical protein [Clostridiaceae bacterium]
MKLKKTNFIIVTVVLLFWLLLALAAWINPSQEISLSERRLLQQAPKLEPGSVASGQFMRDFEDYAKDQFPVRDTFRSLKALTRYYALAQADNNDIYIVDGYASKLEFPLKENSVNKAAAKFRAIYEEYIRDTDSKIYLSVIPDKNYYLAEKHGYPAMDYDRLFALIRQDVDFAEYIDITDQLTITDYYKSDLHWKQENLAAVVEKIAGALGVSDQLTGDFTNQLHDKVFTGVYAGQSALPLQPDRIVYLTNKATASSTVYNAESGLYTPVYDLEKLDGRDPYDVYLSGAVPLLVIENPAADTERELVIFRDSFASSLAPLLLEGYAKITLVDIRYMSSSLIGNYVSFSNQDVLFLYNTLILNSSEMLK